VLAAGLSRRCPPGKLFLPWGEGNIIEAVLANLLAARPDGILVVLGHREVELRKFLEDSPCETVFNPRYLQGMGTSVVAGMEYWQAAPEFSDQAGLMLMPADTPFISSDIIAGIIKDYREGRGDIVVTSHGGRRGHPVIFNRCFFPELRRACLDGQGARETMRSHPESIWYFEAGPEVLEDIDTIQDYNRVIERKR